MCTASRGSQEHCKGTLIKCKTELFSYHNISAGCFMIGSFALAAKTLDNPLHWMRERFCICFVLSYYYFMHVSVLFFMIISAEGFTYLPLRITCVTIDLSECIMPRLNGCKLSFAIIETRHYCTSFFMLYSFDSTLVHFWWS